MQTETISIRPPLPRILPEVSQKPGRLKRLKSRGQAHHQRICGMQSRVKKTEDRDALEEIRQRLVTVLRAIAQAPDKVAAGKSNQIIKCAIAEARAIYDYAPKKRGCGTRKKRPAECNGLPKKQRKERDSRYDGTDGSKVGAIRSGSSAPKRDLIADDLQRQFDQERHGRIEVVN